VIPAELLFPAFARSSLNVACNALRSRTGGYDLIQPLKSRKGGSKCASIKWSAALPVQRRLAAQQDFPKCAISTAY